MSEFRFYRFKLIADGSVIREETNDPSTHRTDSNVYVDDEWDFPWSSTLRQSPFDESNKQRVFAEQKVLLAKILFESLFKELTL